LLRRQPNADLEIRARLLLCDYYSERDRAAAEQQIAAATALLPRARLPALRAGVLTCQGEVREAAGEDAAAQAAFDQAVAVAEGAKDKEMLAGALFSRGYLRGLQGQFSSGLSDLRRSQKLYDQIGRAQHALTALDSIAIIYNRMGDDTEATPIYERALAAQRKAGMRREEAVTLYNLARAHENLGEWEAARVGFAAALAISHQLNHPRGEAYALRGLATVANATGDAAGALALLDRAAPLQRQTPDVRLKAQIQLARGVALHRLRRLPASSAALTAALQVFLTANSLGELATTYDELAGVRAELGDWQSAYDLRSKAESVSKQLLRNQLDQRFATLEVEFDTAAKDKENTLLLRENAINQEALTQERRAGSLQTTVVVLSVLLAAVLGVLVLHQRRSTLRMRTLAMTDELTGLPNRRALLARLAALIQRPETPACSMLIIDVDHFKSINDRHGHPIGDEALRQLSASLRESVREPAFAGRLGGEEFALVLPNSTIDEALATAEALRQRVHALDLARWLADRRITVSIGITTAAPGSDSLSSVLRRADAALYAAKHAGRNCVRSDPPLDDPLSTLWADTRTA
jgi:diguanylate cyclase (GGDEF)-like protein